MEAGRRVHPFFLVLLAATLVAAVAVPLGTRLLNERDQRTAQRMTAIAHAVQLPASLTPLVINHDCNGAGITACGWTTSTQVDDLAAGAQSALSRAAGEQAGRSCSTYHLPNGGDRRECHVQVVSGSHGVSISLDPEVDASDGVVSLIGTRYTVQAS